MNSFQWQPNMSILPCCVHPACAWRQPPTSAIIPAYLAAAFNKKRKEVFGRPDLPVCLHHSFCVIAGNHCARRRFAGGNKRRTICKGLYRTLYRMNDVKEVTDAAGTCSGALQEPSKRVFPFPPAFFGLACACMHWFWTPRQRCVRPEAARDTGIHVRSQRVALVVVRRCVVDIVDDILLAFLA